MQSWIALIASFVIGGLVMLQLGRFSADATTDLYVDTLDHLTHNNLDELVDIVEYDFSRIGLGINDPSQAVFVTADSAELEFYLDNDGDGTLESIRYHLGNTASASATDNPRDKLLYRVVNGGADESISAGLTEFKIEYYNASGVSTTDLSAIRSLVVSVRMESDIIYDDRYAQVVWQEKITPPSLVTR